jgi:CheY-like chemotaxis protein
LGQFGYETEGVRGGKEALSVFAEARHALLLTDHRMPGMSGAELIRRLRERCPALPVIALTGAGPEAKRELLAAGADEVLRKPFDVRGIREAVERALTDGTREE